MNKKVKQMVAASIIAAMYAATTMLLAPISYGGVFEFRVSEVLCILPFFMPLATWGLTIGCAIANLISAAGILDVVFGAFASLLAGLGAAYMGKLYRKNVENNTMTKAKDWALIIFACAMPVIFNTPIIGAVLAKAFTPDAFWAGFITFSTQIFVGEVVILYVLGLPALKICQKNKFLTEIFEALQ